MPIKLYFDCHRSYHYHHISISYNVSKVIAITGRWFHFPRERHKISIMRQRLRSHFLVFPGVLTDFA